jgi:mRNA interferase RelE/StbE
MNYKVVFKPRALKDLNGLPESETSCIMLKIEGLQESLAGDVKKLAAFTPEYRLRVGNYRVLHREEAYR